jgi:hypothetical protein
LGADVFVRRVRRLAVVLFAVVGLFAVGLPRAGASPIPGTPAPSGTTGLSRTGDAPPALASTSDGSNGPLAQMNVDGSASQQADEAAVTAASKQAKASGKPVTVAALTTATSTTTAEPDGKVRYTENVLPVRVQRGKSWVTVSTALAKDPAGMLAPAAVPGDSVEFSDGRSGPLAVISAEGTSLSLSWPGSVPVPVVSGSSATYASILPGVNLILTATSAEAGGFSSVIEVTSAAAARDPQLASLELAVHATGVTLREGTGGSLVASGTRANGEYTAAAPVMWDSSSASSSAAAAGKSARSAGASLAPPGLGGPRSTSAGPSRGARMARVGTRVSAGGTKLGLVPDAALLSSKSTVFPVFIDPSFSWTTTDGDEMNYDEVQSACPTASHYDTTDTTDYWSLGVGYDGFGDDCNGADGYAYSYYEVKVPTDIWGGYIDDATVNAQEAYTASCSASADVTLSWTYGMNSGTDWDNMPGVISNLATNDVGPGPSDSCNDEYDESSGDWLGEGFGVTSTIAKAASGHWSNFTFRLWENGNSDDVDWKRFGKNPYLQITYTQAPVTPSGLQISTSGAGTDCTTSPYPWVGDLDSTGGTTMSAVVADPSGKGVGNELEGIFEYKEASSSTWTTVDSTSTAITSGDRAEAEIPASFTNALADGTEVEWQVEASNGNSGGEDEYSGWSADCYFYADPTDPPAPTVAAGFTSDPAAGSQVSFTITSNDTTSDPAKEFVWGLDDVPPTSDPAAAQVVTLTSGETSATVTLSVPGPGPHAFYAYAKDAAGNDSAWSGTDDPVTFSATADTNVTYDSFADALDAGKSFDNIMISSSASESGTADADGAGDSFSSAQLESAGWKADSTVTVDGATFTLPDFGTGDPDNILAANQTIDLPAGSEGTSLVFLVAGVNANADALDSTDLPTGDVTAPYVAAGSRVVGEECDSYQAGLDDSPCTVPAGTISYTSASGAIAESYYLTAPDWVSGPAGPAAIEFPDRATPTGLAADGPKIYAFSVPLNPDAQVASVTLPDVGSSLSAAGGVTDGRDAFAGLHVLGIAVSNTTTATPGSSTALASGQTWTGAWASPTEGAYASLTGTDFGNQTFRIAMQASAGGSAVRLRLSDDLGWLAGSSGEPLDIGDVTVAAQDDGASVSGTPVQATFGGSASVIIPEGGDVYSDPVDLTVTPGEYLTVSIYLANGASGSAYPDVPYLVQHSMCSACAEYISAEGSGDDASNTDGSPFSGTGTEEGQFTDILTGLDVESTGTGTVAVLGDGLVDALGADTTPPQQGVRISDDLASELQSQAGTGNDPAFGVIGEGIESNQVLTDTDTSTTGTGGPSALSRLAQDILADPGVGTVIVDEGLEDLLQAGDSSTIEGNLSDAYNELANQLNAWGITVIFATMTPCSGYAGSGSQTPEDACTTGTAPTVEANRFDFNNAYLMPEFGSNLCLLGPCQLAVDLDSAVSTEPPSGGNLTDSPVEALVSADNCGDDVNLSDAGYLAETDTIPIGSDGSTSDLLDNSPPDY